MHDPVHDGATARIDAAALVIGLSTTEHAPATRTEATEVLVDDAVAPKRRPWQIAALLALASVVAFAIVFVMKR